MAKFVDKFNDRICLQFLPVFGSNMFQAHHKVRVFLWGISSEHIIHTQKNEIYAHDISGGTDHKHAQVRGNGDMEDPTDMYVIIYTVYRIHLEMLSNCYGW